MAAHTQAPSAIAELAFVDSSAQANTALLRRSPQDFQVIEQIDIEHSGEGEHLWIELEKTGLTTPQIASRLASHFAIQVRDVGYSGLKDRQAVTRQWFSVPTPGDGMDLPELPGVTWLQCQRHSRKLRRGAHTGNAFVLRLHEFRGDAAITEAALIRVRDTGFPNYFGDQRFAHGRNLEAARRLFDGARLKRPARSMALSAARAMLFNEVLHERVASGSWNQLLAGEAVMLDGSHSVFPMPQAPAEREALAQRLAAFDVHPSGPLPGTGSVVCSAEAQALESQVCARHPEFIDGLHRFGVKQARRALRVKPRALAWCWPTQDSLLLEFSLPTGVFATALLRECMQANTAATAA